MRIPCSVDDHKSFLTEDGLNQWKFIAKMNSNESTLSSGTKFCTPLLQAPSYSEVNEWVKTRNSYINTNKNKRMSPLKKGGGEVKCEAVSNLSKDEKVSGRAIKRVDLSKFAIQSSMKKKSNSLFCSSTPMLSSTKHEGVDKFSNVKKRRICSGEWTTEDGSRFVDGVSPLSSPLHTNKKTRTFSGLDMKRDGIQKHQTHSNRSKIASRLSDAFEKCVDQEPSERVATPDDLLKGSDDLLKGSEDLLIDPDDLKKGSDDLLKDPDHLSGESDSNDECIDSSLPLVQSPLPSNFKLNINTKKKRNSKRATTAPSPTLDDTRPLSLFTSSATPPLPSSATPPLPSSATPPLPSSATPPPPSSATPRASSLHKLLTDSQFRRHYQLGSCNNTTLLQSATSGSNEFDSSRHRNSFGFRYKNHDLQTARALHQHQYVGSLCLEVHTSCRGDLLPDPGHDPVMVVVLIGVKDLPPEEPNQDLKVVIAVGGCSLVGVPDDVTLLHVTSEATLLEKIVTLVRKWDPDILLGYEVQNRSWGYILERCKALGGENLASQLSRVPAPDSQSSHHDPEMDPYGAMTTSHIHVGGRIVLNIWRLMKDEVPLTNYSFENICHHLLHVRVPQYTHSTLRKWWEDEITQSRVVSHYMLRCSLTIKLLERLDLINRTSELARLFGIEFFDVLSRGTQFRVESMMLRLSRSNNMVALSPSVQHRAKMSAPEWLALNMEPRSRLYTDPVVVVDFQSLYPSIMIAHNYCYSTCLGKVDRLTGPQPFSFGTTNLKVHQEELEQMVDELHISPCGVAFVPKRVRRGILPQMLEEILNTRIMVKQSMKLHKEDSTLQKALHSRQLGLKLIANVTYGYTSANFSGRMPCVELGDSVVSKSRETLERAIKLVQSTPRWGGEVVYGDTDSMFIHFPGKTKDQAFDIGYEIADAVTKMNPKPVKLKFEKVYLPCILQTKKRYVGLMYESKDQKEGVLEAKGIEIVRRDGCPLVTKVLEKSLKVLFNKLDVSLVRQYLSREFSRLLSGAMPIGDLTFAREYRGSRGYKPGACVPALYLARQRLQVDPRAEPLAGERVPYVIIYGAPGLPLIKLVRSPLDLLSPGGSSLRPNYIYYATRVLIPALNRCFSLIGVKVIDWYNSTPRTLTTPSALGPDSRFLSGADSMPLSAASVSTISHFFSSVACVVCLTPTQQTAKNVKEHSGGNVCNNCLSEPQKTVLFLEEKIKEAERTAEQTAKVCRACTGFRTPQGVCISIDCPILDTVTTATRNLQSARVLLRPVLKKFNCSV